MLPKSLDAITYQDIFRLLHQRQSNDFLQVPTSTQKGKENIQNISQSPFYQEDKSVSNNNPGPKLPIFMLLEMLNQSTQSLQPSKLQNVSNLFFDQSDSKGSSKALSETDSTKPTLRAQKNLSENKRSTSGGEDLSTPVKQTPELINRLSFAKNLIPEQVQSSPGDSSLLDIKSKKISKKTNECGHPERAHYAKNMCNQCYHKHGRTKKPWKCNHEKLYAHGLCQNCYINAYNRRRSQKLKEKSEEVCTKEIKEPLILDDNSAFETS